MNPTVTVQKSDKSFKRKKGPNFIFLFNYGWSLVSKTGIFKIATGAVFNRPIVVLFEDFHNKLVAFDKLLIQISHIFGCVTIVLLKVSIWAPKNRGH